MTDEQAQRQGRQAAGQGERLSHHAERTQGTAAGGGQAGQQAPAGTGEDIRGRVGDELRAADMSQLDTRAVIGTPGPSARIHVGLEDPDGEDRAIEIMVEPLNPPHKSPCDDSLCGCQWQYLSLTNAQGRSLMEQLRIFYEQGIQTIKSA